MTTDITAISQQIAKHTYSKPDIVLAMHQVGYPKSDIISVTGVTSQDISNIVSRGNGNVQGLDMRHVELMVVVTALNSTIDAHRRHELKQFKKINRLKRMAGIWRNYKS